MLEPPPLLTDEPMGNLDAESGERVLDRLSNSRRGTVALELRDGELG